MKKIIFGNYQSSIGEMVLAKSEGGLCWLGFMVNGCKGNGYERMIKHFPNAELYQDDNVIKSLGDYVIKMWEQGKEKEIKLDLYGSVFQKSVWRALLEIKRGKVKSYGDIANNIGRQKASRAVGGAVGSNPVSLIVPCHRVINKSGAIGNYGWGVHLKRHILSIEGLQI